MTVLAITRPVLAAVHVALDRPSHAAADKQIELPIVVEIEEPCAGAPAVGGHAGARRDVGEGTVPVVVVQDVAAVLRDVEIVESVVVVVANCGAHAVGGAGDVRLLGDVGEGAVPVVAIEAAPEPPRPLSPRRRLPAPLP